MIPHSSTLLSGLILSFTIKFNCIHVYAHVLCLSVSMYICVQMSVEGRECFWFLGIGGTAGCMLYNMSAGNRPPVLSKSNACLPLISKPSFQLWLWFFFSVLAIVSCPFMRHALHLRLLKALSYLELLLSTKRLPQWGTLESVMKV